MLHGDRSIPTRGGLLLFKWLMILIPPLTLTVGHSLPQHAVDRRAQTLFVAVLALVLASIFAESMFRTLRRVQAEALAREQDIVAMNAVTQERERLSRELHDGAAQLVAHLLLRLDTIKDLLGAGRPKEAAEELERLHEVADEIYEDIGESISGIRTNVADRGLTRTLQDYVDQFEERYTIPVSLRTDEAADQFAPLAAFQLFRFIQEALTNVRKHAGAQAVTITLTNYGVGQFRIVIADDGQGFVPGNHTNGKTRPLGLTSMEERITSLGGTIRVESRPGSGTHVIAIVPIPGSGRKIGHVAFANTPG